MPDTLSLIRRLTATVGLAVALLSSATLLGPVAAADPGLPFIAASSGPLEVQVRGTSASVRLTSAEPALFSLTLKSAHGTTTPSAYPLPLIAIPGSIPVPPTYKIDHSFTLADLRSNTAYTLEVKATTAKGQTLSHAASFTTLKQRVRLVLDKIRIADDGDWVGKGEPTWYWAMEWDGSKTGGCYPYRSLCEPGSTGEGTIYPTNPKGEKLTVIFAEENFAVLPERFTLGVTADESDLLSLGAVCIPCEFNPPTVTTLHVPTGSESSSQEIAIAAHKDGMRSTMYFRFETFHDALAYPATSASRVHSNY